MQEDVVYIVITDFDTFVLCTHPPKYTKIRFKHEMDFSWVKIIIEPYNLKTAGCPPASEVCGPIYVLTG